jgi:P2 family phage contractile tail tube protein
VSQIPERLVNFNCYGGAAAAFLGMTDIELPSFEAMKETIQGAGIAGEYESPVLGHFGPQKVKLKWRTLTREALGLLAPVRQVFDVRGSIQLQDPMLGTLITQAIRVECTGQISMQNLGKLEPGKVMGVETDVEIAKIKISLDNVEIIELDKFNFIFRINGFDYLQKVRQDMGGV